jgi:hypothetical protein
MSQGTPDGIKSYSEFWPFYVREHSNPVSRALHVCGTMLALTVLGIIAAKARWDLLWLPLVAGYGFAWIGHFVFQKNKPATFRYPLWSFISDFKMLILTLSGRMPEQIRRHVNQVDS